MSVEQRASRVESLAREAVELSERIEPGPFTDAGWADDLGGGLSITSARGREVFAVFAPSGSSLRECEHEAASRSAHRDWLLHARTSLPALARVALAAGPMRDALDNCRKIASWTHGKRNQDYIRSIEDIRRDAMDAVSAFDAAVRAVEEGR